MAKDTFVQRVRNWQQRKRNLHLYGSETLRVEDLLFRASFIFHLCAMQTLHTELRSPLYTLTINWSCCAILNKTLHCNNNTFTSQTVSPERKRFEEENLTPSFESSFFEKSETFIMLSGEIKSESDVDSQRVLATLERNLVNKCTGSLWARC